MEEVGGICSNPELPSVEEPAAIVSEYQPSDAERASPSAFSKPHERVRLPLRIRGKPNHLKPGTMPVLGIEASIRSFWTKQVGASACLRVLLR